MITPRTDFADLSPTDRRDAVVDATADGALKVAAHVLAANFGTDMASGGEICTDVASGLLAAAIHWAFATSGDRSDAPILGATLHTAVDELLLSFREHKAEATQAMARALAGTPLPAVIGAHDGHAGRA